MAVTHYSSARQTSLVACVVWAAHPPQCRFSPYGVLRMPCSLAPTSATALRSTVGSSAGNWRLHSVQSGRPLRPLWSCVNVIPRSLAHCKSMHAITRGPKVACMHASTKVNANSPYPDLSQLIGFPFDWASLSNWSDSFVKRQTEAMGDVPDPWPYLPASFPAEFKGCADAVFVLTDAGHVELPIHSAMLCAKSSFFCTFFQSQANVSRSEVITVPLPDTDLEEALAFLQVMYLPDGFDKLSAKSCKAAVKLFHMFNMEDLLSKSDALLGRLADAWSQWVDPDKRVWVSAAAALRDDHPSVMMISCQDLSQACADIVFSAWACMQDKPEEAVDAFLFASQYSLYKLAQSSEKYIATNWRMIRSSPSGSKKTELLDGYNVRCILDIVCSISSPPVGYYD